MLLAKARTNTPVNLVNPIPINTEETVFLSVSLSLSSGDNLEGASILIHTCALNSTESPTQVIKLTT